MDDTPGGRSSWLCHFAGGDDERGASTLTTTAPAEAGYFAQPEMGDFVATALELGWTLVAYEQAWEATPLAHRENPLTWDATNHREQAQAENLLAAWHRIGEAPMLAWCGNAHHAKIGAPQWTPMGARFTRHAGFTADNPPAGLEVPDHFDALILSTDSVMVGDVSVGP